MGGELFYQPSYMYVRVCLTLVRSVIVAFSGHAHSFLYAETQCPDMLIH